MCNEKLISKLRLRSHCILISAIITVMMLACLCLIIFLLMPLFIDDAEGDFGFIKTSSSRKKGKEDCSKAHCQDPPEPKKCKEVPPSDESIPRPTGKYANCCPLWKCGKKSDPDSYYTFHGYEGGSETVYYTKHEDGSWSTQSEATGDHDASAIAVVGGTFKDFDNTFQDMMGSFMSAFNNDSPKKKSKEEPKPKEPKSNQKQPPKEILDAYKSLGFTFPVGGVYLCKYRPKFRSTHSFLRAPNTKHNKECVRRMCKIGLDRPNPLLRLSKSAIKYAEKKYSIRSSALHSSKISKKLLFL